VQRENGGQIIDAYKVHLKMLYESEQSAFEVVLGVAGGAKKFLKCVGAFT